MQERGNVFDASGSSTDGEDEGSNPGVGIVPGTLLFGSAGPSTASPNNGVWGAGDRHEYIVLDEFIVDIEQELDNTFEVPEESEYAESGSSSDDTDTDPSDEEICSICSRRYVDHQFVDCCNQGLCGSCFKNMWWRRVKAPTHWPTYFPCPFCRHEIDYVKTGAVGAVGKKRYSLREWMLKTSKRAAWRLAVFPTVQDSEVPFDAEG